MIVHAAKDETASDVDLSPRVTMEDRKSPCSANNRSSALAINSCLRIPRRSKQWSCYWCCCCIGSAQLRGYSEKAK